MSGNGKSNEINRKYRISADFAQGVPQNMQHFFHANSGPKYSNLNVTSKSPKPHLMMEHLFKINSKNGN